VEFIKTFLEQQPMMALFLTIAIGYLVGEVNIKGFSLGVGAVLFVALAMGWFAPKSVPAAMVGTLGLALFLYTVGVQYGKQFFSGLTSRNGRRANLVGLSGVVFAGAVSLLLMKTIGVSVGNALGLFAGAGTSTPALQAAIEALRNNDPAVGYSVSYPIGVAGPILFLYLAFMILKPKMEASEGTGLEILEILVRKGELTGKTLAEVMTTLPTGVQIVAKRTAGRNEPVSPTAVLADNDVLLAVGASKEALSQAGKSLGEESPGLLVRDREHLDYLRVFASRPAVVGRALSDLELPGKNGSVILHVRRGDADLMAQPNLILEFGDRVGLLADRDRFVAMRKFFGDSIKGTAEFSYISIGLGMALGFLIGAVQVPLPIIGKLVVGLAGTDTWKSPPHRQNKLDHSAFRQPGSQKLWVNPLPRTGGNVFWTEVRGDGLGNRFPNAGAWRCRPGCTRSPGRGPWLVCLSHAVRRGCRYCFWCLWESSNPRLFEQTGTHGQTRSRLCNDFPRHDDSQNPLRRYRRKTVLKEEAGTATLLSTNLSG